MLNLTATTNYGEKVTIIVSDLNGFFHGSPDETVTVYAIDESTGDEAVGHVKKSDLTLTGLAE